MQTSYMSITCFFSKLDSSSGYWQIKVDEETSHLLAFSTPIGCYRLKDTLKAFDNFKNKQKSV